MIRHLPPAALAALLVAESKPSVEVRHWSLPPAAKVYYTPAERKKIDARRRKRDAAKASRKRNRP